MVICLERDADLHMAQLMPLPLTVSCFSKIQIGFTFLVPAHLGSPRKTAVKRVCVCVAVTSFRPITWTEFFWRLLICFVIKLENIQVVNYVETNVKWEQWAVADSDSE